MKRKIRRNSQNWVKVKVGEHLIPMFTDSGSDATIIPPDKYHEDMGPIVKTNDKLRAYGSKDYLSVKGVIRNTWIANGKGLGVRTDIYIVN